MNIEKVLGIKFNKKQKASTVALRWFLNDGPAKTVSRNGAMWGPVQKNRGSGRTELTLALIIEKALKNPGKPVPIIDHAMLSGQIPHSNNRFLKARIEKNATSSQNYQLQHTHYAATS